MHEDDALTGMPEEVLRQADRLHTFEAVVEHAPDGIAVFENFHTTYINPAAAAMCHAPREELIGLPATAFHALGQG